jgi:hypothetical protein
VGALKPTAATVAPVAICVAINRSAAITIIPVFTFVTCSLLLVLLLTLQLPIMLLLIMVLFLTGSHHDNRSVKLFSNILTWPCL